MRVELDHVVGDQAVAAADELERRARSCRRPTVAGDQHAHAEHVHEHAVALGRFGERACAR